MNESPKSAGSVANDRAPCELTVLMPCLDEGETIAACIAKANAYLVRSKVDGEVLVVDNGSSDGSPEIARRAGPAHRADSPGVPTSKALR